MHLAGLLEGEDSLQTLDVNLRGTYHVLEAARLQGVGRVVFASSIAATGCLSPSFVPEQLPIRENEPCRPDGPYAASKLAAEAVCNAYATRYGITTIALRIAGVQRPAEWDEPPWEMQRSPILWTWISARDASQAIIAAIDASIEGPVVANVAAEDSCSLRPTGDLIRAFLPDPRSATRQTAMETAGPCSIWTRAAESSTGNPSIVSMPCSVITARLDGRPADVQSPGRQRDHETRPAVAVRLEEDPAAHRGHQPARGEQADPRAATATAPLDPDERLEDALPVLARDAGAVVCDVDLDLVADPPDADAHALGRRRVLRFVLEELLEDLPEACLVADRGHRPGRALPADRARAEEQAQRLDGVVDRRDRIERGARQPGQPLAANGRQDRIDEAVEPPELLHGRGVPGQPGPGPSPAAAASPSRST